MAQTAEKDEEMSAAKIYEFLKTKNVTTQIFQEMLSEMKDKKSFKQVKKMIEGLISKHEKVLYNPDTDKSERSSIFNELCTISFTIDTIFPNVLRMKLQQEFPRLINEILEELKTEKRIDSFAPCTEPQVSGNADAASSTKISSIPSNVPSPKPVSPGKNTIKYESLKSSRVNGTSVKTSSEDPVMPKQKNSRSARNLKSNQEPVQEIIIPKKELETIGNADSDAESDISIGHLSILSVSSVHTSELSSFDDAISVSSSEEGSKKKRKISCNELKIRLGQSNTTPELYNEELDSSDSSESPHSTKEKVDMKTVRDSKSGKSQTKVSVSEEFPTSSISSEPLSPQKILPQRKRKPNSRYSSDSILCPSTKRLHKRAQHSDVSYDRSDNSTLHSPPKSMKMDTLSENINIEASRKEQKCFDEPESADDNLRNTKLSNSPDVCKPYIAVHPLTSRRAAPMKLFSTSMQSLKKC